MSQRVVNKGNQCLENIKSMIDKMKNDIHNQKLSLSQKSVEIKKNVAKLSDPVKNRTPLYYSPSSRQLITKKPSLAQRKRLNLRSQNQNSLFRLSMSEEQLGSSKRKKERSSREIFPETFDEGQLFRLTQSRENFENKISGSGIGLKFTKEKQHNVKIAKRAEYLNEKLMTQLNRKVQKLETENLNLRSQNKELSSKLEICLDEIDSMEKIDLEMQNYILELENVISELTSRNIQNFQNKKRSYLEQKLNEPLVVQDATVKNYNQKTKDFEIVEPQVLLQTSSDKTLIKENSQTLDERSVQISPSKYLKPNPIVKNSKSQSKVATGSSLFSKYPSKDKDRFAIAKLNIKIERMAQEKEREINHRDDLIEDLWNEVKRYRKNEKELVQKYRNTKRANKIFRTQRQNMRNNLRSKKQSKRRKSVFNTNSTIGYTQDSNYVGMTTEEMYNDTFMDSVEGENKENSILHSNIDIQGFGTNDLRDSIDINLSNKKRGKRRSKKAPSSKILKNKAYQQLKLLNQTCTNMKRRNNLNKLRKICGTASKDSSVSPKSKNNTQDSYLTMDKEIFGDYCTSVTQSKSPKKDRRIRARFNTHTTNTNDSRFTEDVRLANSTSNTFEFNDSIERFDSKFNKRANGKKNRRKIRFLKIKNSNVSRPLESIDDGSLSPPRYISKSRSRQKKKYTRKRSTSKKKSQRKRVSPSKRKVQYLSIEDDDVFLTTTEDQCDKTINKLAKVSFSLQ